MFSSLSFRQTWVASIYSGYFIPGAYSSCMLQGMPSHSAKNEDNNLNKYI